MYQLRLTAKAKKQLKLITKTFQKEAISNALLEIKADPFIGKSLTRELSGMFSYTVSVFRIIYMMNEKDKTVYILTAGHRATIYE